jgi:hypothetical protein
MARLELQAAVSAVDGRGGTMTGRRADMAQVERMITAVEAQAAQLPPSHRYW